MYLSKIVTTLIIKWKWKRRLYYMTFTVTQLIWNIYTSAFDKVNFLKYFERVIPSRSQEWKVTDEEKEIATETFFLLFQRINTISILLWCFFITMYFQFLIHINGCISFGSAMFSPTLTRMACKFQILKKLTVRGRWRYNFRLIKLPPPYFPSINVNKAKGLYSQIFLWLYGYH